MAKIPLIVLASLGIAQSSVAEQFAVRANPGQWKGISDVEKVFQQFEIRLFTDDDSDKRPLNWDGEALFDVDRAKVRRLEWTTPAQPPPKFVLWPRVFKNSGQQAVPSPFTRFQLFSLKELWRETKNDAADSIRRGSFDGAENIFRDVNDLYRPYLDDPSVSASLFYHQIYENMSDAAARFRKSKDFRDLTADEKKKVVELERGWHRSMIERYSNKTDDANNRRLASTLRRWSEFARSIHAGKEWPSESVNTAKSKQPLPLTGDLNTLHEDLDQVAGALFSRTIAPDLRERIKKNLAPDLQKGPTALEKKQLTSYQDLAALREGQDSFVDEIRLDELDRAISALGYFYHPESEK